MRTSSGGHPAHPEGRELSRLDRLDHCCQPFELPVAAFYSPPLPVGEHVGGSPAISVW